MNAVGQPLSRVEGPMKVTGAARYTADAAPSGALHGALVHSTIANGRIRKIDTRAAAASPGVVRVFTHENMMRFNPLPQPWDHWRPHGQRYLPLQDDHIHYAGQPVALRAAVAQGFAQARPLEQNAFKIELSQRAVLRALQTAGARA